MKLLILGSGGQLGTDFVREARLKGHEVIGKDYPEVDLTRRESVMQVVKEVLPQVIVNCTAFTAVDLCEEKQVEAFALNAQGCGFLAEAAAEHSSLLIHFSTDYVFSGQGSRPYTEEDATEPGTVYGRSKLEGERQIAAILAKIMIFRIAWLYGVYGNNFVKSIRTIGAKCQAENKPLKVVNDQFGTPTWTVDVCRQVLKVMNTPNYGVFHCTSEGSCSWFDFAKEIIIASGIQVEVSPCTTAEFPRPAPRPAYSVLENARLKKLGLNIMPNWQEGFRAFLEAEKRITEQE